MADTNIGYTMWVIYGYAIWVFGAYGWEWWQDRRRHLAAGATCPKQTTENEIAGHNAEIIEKLANKGQRVPETDEGE